jgi:DNA-directed RNA polymerase subunit K/omega
MNYKHSTAEKNTITRNTVDIEEKTGNVYESIIAVSKRADQITVEIKEELSQKLQAFALPSDNLEEIFENREQIEISKFYEKLPKPVSIALDEFMEDKMFRKLPEEEA